MTREEVATMIDNMGYPYAYYQFPEGTGQVPPFICFFFTTSNDLYADETNYVRIDGLSIEFYSSEKDFDAETAIEAAINENGLTFYKEENYIDSEKMWQIAYDIDVLITEIEEENG